MILDRLDVDPEEFTARTGWAIKPKGACSGEVCVPLPDEVTTEDGLLRAPALAERLGAPLLHDEPHGLWALGPAAVSGRTLTTAEAPEVTLPDIHGEPFSLSSLRGQRVVLTAWASW